MALSNDVKKALQTIRKDVDADASHVRYLLDELERHLGLKSDAPAVPVAAPVVAPADQPSADVVDERAAEGETPEAPAGGGARRNW